MGDPRHRPARAGALPVRRSLTLIVCAAGCALPAAASAAPVALTHTLAQSPSPLGPVRHSGTAASSSQPTSAETPVPVPGSDTPPAHRKLSADRVLSIADALPKMR